MDPPTAAMALALMGVVEAGTFLGGNIMEVYFTIFKERAKHSKKVNGRDGRRTLRECTIEKALMDPIFNGNKGLIGPVRSF